MPVYNETYGYGDNTLKKFSDFDNFIKDYLPIAREVLRKNINSHWCDKTYHYIDLNAGPGIVPHNLISNSGEVLVPKGSMGSPFTFIKWAENYWQPLRGLKYEVTFIENNPYLAEMLLNNLRKNPLKYGFGNGYIGDHNIVIPEILREFIPWRFGLVYHDPNNGQVSFDTLLHCNKMRPRYEILINLPGSLFKRRPEHYNEEKKLFDYISMFLTDKGEKKRWFIKELADGDKHQWTFLLCTGWPNKLKFNRIGLYEINEPRGADILEAVNLSKKQLKKKLQPTLPIENI